MEGRIWAAEAVGKVDTVRVPAQWNGRVTTYLPLRGGGVQPCVRTAQDGKMESEFEQHGGFWPASACLPGWASSVSLIGRIWHRLGLLPQRPTHDGTPRSCGTPPFMGK